MKATFDKNYSEIISVENLLAAWQEFVVGKASKRDVQNFRLNLPDNILQLHVDLANKSYKHGGYTAFGISDPKPRRIHKASVRDRVLHHAVYRQLYPFFDRLFIAHSFSCRDGKGTHRAMDALKSFAYQVSVSHTKTCWVLKCDIKKFFASIDHGVLIKILEARIADENILWLLMEIISSFESIPSKGLPLGNLTSQLFCNVYMNEFDQFVKRELRSHWYIRYAADFVFLSESRKQLEEKIPLVSNFLGEKLKLSLHPNKVSIQSFASGVDFLGWIHFPNYRTLRTATKRRMIKQVKTSPKPQTLQSYLGMLQHGNAYDLSQEVLDEFLLLGNK